MATYAEGVSLHAIYWYSFDVLAGVSARRCTVVALVTRCSEASNTTLLSVLCLGNLTSEISEILCYAVRPSGRNNA